MSKILRSRYSIYKNFEEDVTGHFLFKMKRRDITRRLLSYSRVLNRVEPLRLSDLLIRRKKRIKGLSSQDRFKFMKFRFFYGFFKGKTKIFNKSYYGFLQSIRENRLSSSIASLESRVDVLLLRLRLFNSIRESRIFIKSEGVLVDGKLITNFNHRLNPGQILSFTDKFSIILKRKVYRMLRARPPQSPFKNKAIRELNSLLTPYTWLFKRYTKLSPFFLIGFPRYIEPNFNTMEFYFYGNILLEDLFYPFKTLPQDRSGFFNNLI